MGRGTTICCCFESLTQKQKQATKTVSAHFKRVTTVPPRPTGTKPSSAASPPPSFQARGAGGGGEASRRGRPQEAGAAPSHPRGGAGRGGGQGSRAPTQAHGRGGPRRPSAGPGRYLGFHRGPLPIPDLPLEAAEKGGLGRPHVGDLVPFAHGRCPRLSRAAASPPNVWAERARADGGPSGTQLTHLLPSVTLSVT